MWKDEVDTWQIFCLEEWERWNTICDKDLVRKNTWYLFPKYSQVIESANAFHVTCPCSTMYNDCTKYFYRSTRLSTYRRMTFNLVFAISNSFCVFSADYYYFLKDQSTENQIKINNYNFNLKFYIINWRQKINVK